MVDVYRIYISLRSLTYFRCPDYTRELTCTFSTFNNIPYNTVKENDLGKLNYLKKVFGTNKTQSR